MEETKINRVEVAKLLFSMLKRASESCASPEYVRAAPEIAQILLEIL